MPYLPKKKIKEMQEAVRYNSMIDQLQNALRNNPKLQAEITRIGNELVQSLYKVHLKEGENEGMVFSRDFSGIDVGYRVIPKDGKYEVICYITNSYNEKDPYETKRTTVNSIGQAEEFIKNTLKHEEEKTRKSVKNVPSVKDQGYIKFSSGKGGMFYMVTSSDGGKSYTLSYHTLGRSGRDKGEFRDLKSVDEVRQKLQEVVNKYK